MTFSRAHGSQDEGRPLPGVAPDSPRGLSANRDTSRGLPSKAPRWWAIYVRRSYKDDEDGDVSEAAQQSVATRRLPPGAMVKVYEDSSGHNSGSSANRPNYQRLLADVRAGHVEGITAYDSSRLNRNAENAMALLRECQAGGVSLLLSDTMRPGEVFQPDGELNYGLLAIVAQHMRQQQSKRIRDLLQHTFEQGGHRGHDPFGYESIRDAEGRVAQPRQLVIVEREAEVVRHVFRELAQRPFAEIADVFNREGIQHRTPRPWSQSAIKDIWRRHDVYRGFVVKKRGLDTRPGQHDAIVDEATYLAARLAIEQRRTSRGPKPKGAKRLYMLRGLVYCSCGARRRGTARRRGAVDHRYYVCPVAEERSAIFGPDGEPVICPEKAVRAEEAEAVVLEMLNKLALPDEAVRLARGELRRRLRAREKGTSERDRTRLLSRKENLRKQHEWGDISDNEWLVAKREIENTLAVLPDDDKLVLFDREREVLLSMAENIVRAKPEQLQRLLARIVERVETADKQVVRVVWTPAARPFLAPVDDASVRLSCPQGDSNP